MRRWSKLPILLMLALVFANAQCFAQCLAQSGDSARSHCHQHGPAKAGHCVQQHDLQAGAAVMPALDCSRGASVEGTDITDETSWFSIELLAPSPPLSGKTTPLPLRV